MIPDFPFSEILEVMMAIAKPLKLTIAAKTSNV